MFALKILHRNTAIAKVVFSCNINKIMYKYKNLLLFIIVFMTIFSSCNKHFAAHKAERHYYYTCPMHPDDIYFQPGKCPKCGMVLDVWNIEDLPRKKTSTSNVGNPGSGGHSGHNH